MRGGTLAERILAQAAGRPVRAGDVITVSPETVMVHDSIAPQVIRLLEEDLGVDRVPHPERVAVAIDHVSPAANVATAEAQAGLRRWVRKQGIERFHDAGRGIAHQILIEEHIARPGAIVVGSDSHSTAYGAVAAFGTGLGATDIAVCLATGRTWLRVPETVRIDVRGRLEGGLAAKDVVLAAIRRLGASGVTYGALEWHGIDDWSVGQRTTLASMAVEAGAKVGIVSPAGLPADRDVPEWLLGVDDAAVYRQRITLELSDLTPQIARPDNVDDVIDLDSLGHVPVDVVYVGTCTNGRHEDLATVARIMDGRPVAPGVRLMVVPASRDTLEAAIADGTLAALVGSGAIVGPPGCGACIGRHMGVLAPGETCLFTGNRNFRGRMGSPDARIYLGSPEVAAATAVLGHIAQPGALQPLVAGAES